jgi:hypothetical protein
MANEKFQIRLTLKEKFLILLIFCIDTIFSILLYSICLCAAKVTSFLKDSYLPFEGLLFKCVFLVLEYSFLIIGAFIAIAVFINEALKIFKNDIKHNKKGGDE